MDPMEATKSAGNFGPLNPETFFAAQKRNRRATWRMSALCTFAAFIMGIPLTLVLTPLLYTIAMVVLETVNHFSPQPELLQQANDLAKFGLRVADFVINQKGTLDPGELSDPGSRFCDNLNRWNMLTLGPHHSLEARFFGGRADMAAVGDKLLL